MWILVIKFRCSCLHGADFTGELSPQWLGSFIKIISFQSQGNLFSPSVDMFFRQSSINCNTRKNSEWLVHNIFSWGSYYEECFEGGGVEGWGEGRNWVVEIESPCVDSATSQGRPFQRGAPCWTRNIYNHHLTLQKKKVFSSQYKSIFDPNFLALPSYINLSESVCWADKMVQWEKHFPKWPERWDRLSINKNNLAYVPHLNNFAIFK